MILKYFEKTDEIIAIEERLEKLTLAFSVELSGQEIQPGFIEGSTEYLGVDKMNAYLDQLDREKEQWYYCSC